MSVRIHRLTLGVANSYLIEDEGKVLVDAGGPNQAKKFLKRLHSLSVTPEDIRLIVITHGHWDHVGSLAELKRLTRAQVAINEHEKEWVELAQSQNPPGIGLWGKVFSAMGRVLGPMTRFPATSVELVLQESDFSLEPYGVRGKVMHTPGHSRGSSTVLLDSGDACVGDLAMNGLPMRIGPGMPCVGDSPSTIRQSWRSLLDAGAKTIYPGHGKPFGAEVLERCL